MYLTETDGNDKVLMTHDQFMKLHDERKQRNIDPFELIVFQETQSNQLKELETIQKYHREMNDIDELSHAPSNAYGGFSKNKKKPQKKKQTSLPRHIFDNKHMYQFGCGTLPSDNMNMVMEHEFEHAFVYK